MMLRYGIPGTAVALVKEGRIVWSGAFGYADVEKKRKMTTDTYCKAESISKPVTAWGVMRLVERGLLDLDRPVVFYLRRWKFPPSSFPSERITTRMLLSQCSGLPLGTIGVRYSPEALRPSLEESLTRDAVVEREPGISFAYSNTGFNLLELLIQEITGRDFAAYMRNEVLIPLGMEKSSFTWSRDMKPPVALGYDNSGIPIPVYIYPGKASGGLFTTVTDIAAFIAAGMGNARSGNGVISAESVKSMYTPVVKLAGYYGLSFDAYGLGYFLEKLPAGHTAISHGGQGTGWMTHFHAVPETGDGIVILTNSQRSWPFFAQVLTDWASWCGFGGVGMSVITRATRMLWILILAIFTGTALMIIRLAKGFRTMSRSIAPLSHASVALRIAQCIAGTAIILVLLWAATRDYLFLTSVFPSASPWLGFVLLGAAAVLLLSALSPEKTGTTGENQQNRNGHA